MGNYLYNEACPQCSKSGRGKSLAVYDDGSKYCHECGHHDGKKEGFVSKPKQHKPLIPPGKVRALPNRHISSHAMGKFKGSLVKYKGRKALCMSYYVGGAIVAQKLKFQKGVEPRYTWLGNKEMMSPLWGMNLFHPNPKLSVTICEGETDMLCLSTLEGNKWPTLSLLDGAGDNKMKHIAQAKEYLTGFARINLLFDGDEAGRKAARAAAEILGPKTRIVQMPDGEDVCSMVAAGRAKELKHLIMTAPGYRPKDIVTIDDYTAEELYTKEARGRPLPFPVLNDLLRGLKQGRLYMLCAGSGSGKSTVAKEIAYDLMYNQSVKVGCIFLEQDDREAMRDYIAMDNNIEAEDFSEQPDIISEQDRVKSEQVLAEKGVFYKHFGSLDADALVSRIEYMMSGCDCELVILDHISMAVSGVTSSQGERKDIDILMTKLRTLIQNTNKSVLAVSHLKRGERDFNQGGQITLSDLRGSASLEQISDFVIALERDQFDMRNSNKLRLKVLKCRRGGRVGYADVLEYSHDTGRLSLSTLEIEDADDKFAETN